MQAQLKINPPLPAKFPMSYGPLQYGQYAVMKCNYKNGDGPIHWCNAQVSIFEPEFKGPLGYTYWFYPGLLGFAQLIPVIDTSVANSYINGLLVNLASGKGFPLTLP
jgi:hypothetical protein